MTDTVDDKAVAEIEALAVDLAREAGRLLAQYFGVPMEIEYKDEQKTDPVTAADRECQDYLFKSILERFPDHGFLGEEGPQDEDSVAPDLVWVVDPLDGTRNFISGLPIFACSIGVLHRGAPIAGAIYTPWPGEEDGIIMHARRGGGAFLQDRPLDPLTAAEPRGDGVATLPGSFSSRFKMDKAMRGKVGEVRVTGSIAYELAMAARGAVQYSVVGGPRIWDVAAAAVLVTEAGGDVQAGRPVRRTWGSGFRWEPLDSFAPDWRSGVTTLDDLRQWSAPLVLGSPGIVRYVTRSIAPRRRRTHWLRRALRRRRS